MVLAREEDSNDPHPYWYARIIGTYHVEVRHTGLLSSSLNVHMIKFVWVRWFERNSGTRAGFKAKRLHRLSFLPGRDMEAFGFINPKDIVRGVHLIAAFTHGRTNELLPRSLGHPSFKTSSKDWQDNDEEEADWAYDYVDMYVPFLRSSYCIY
jgi:hypothetical protein